MFNVYCLPLQLPRLILATSFCFSKVHRECHRTGTIFFLQQKSISFPFPGLLSLLSVCYKMSLSFWQEEGRTKYNCQPIWQPSLCFC